MGSLTSIILAAGKSSRMRESKPLLNFGETNLINYQIKSFNNPFVDEIIVVTGSKSELVKESINSKNIKIIDNPDFNDGKTTSIKKGISAIEKTDNDIILIAVDQPRSKDLIEKVSKFHIEHPGQTKITFPYFEGKGGHPIIFSNNFYSSLLEISEENEGIRDIIKNNQSYISKYKTRDNTALVDLNTKEDYLNHISKFNL